jgi:CheY-like chemotaxis protein
VELMGGRIAFHSEAAVGSCFWFTVPLEKQPGREETASGRPGAASFYCKLEERKARILLAEDHPVNREVMLAMLKRFGYGADSAANGREAVRALQAGHYDLVFMDCQMPEMDGYEASRLVRDPATGACNPGVAIVAVTASAMVGDRERCLQAGMNDYLSKPIEPANLARVLERWLGPAPRERTRDAGRRTDRRERDTCAC